MPLQNEYGQPIGSDLGEWTPPPFPAPETLTGQHVILEPLSWHRHGEDLWDAMRDAPDSLWTYMSFGPFREISDFRATLEQLLGFPDWLPFAMVVSGRAGGFASYLRIQPSEGVIEIGSIVFSPDLQRTTPATEAIYLMIRNVFALGYRRCEWKCDALNDPSRRSADRLGFVYEGTFRQATHYKGRNRDTAWYSLVDAEWPAIDLAFQGWLSPDNFASDGTQIRSLKEMRGTP
jgi:RimJ/RimL family protein N-acetyltransferase